MKKSLFLIAALATAGTTFGSILANEKYVTNTVNTVVYNASTQIIEKVITDHSVTNEAAVAVAKEYTDTKTAAALVTAAADASAKTNAVLTTAKSYTDTEVGNAKTVAAEDATTKANAAKADAITYTEGATNAIASAGNANLVAATNAVDAAARGYANKAEENAINAAATDATTKADAAKVVAAEDATTKATFARTNAIDVAKSYTDAAESNAKTYADGLNTALSATVAANKTDIEGKLSTAKSELNTSIDGVKTRMTTAENNISSNAQSIVELAGKIAGSFHFRGTCLYADLATKSATAGEGDVYTVTDRDNECYAFVKEGETSKWVSLGKNFDLSSYKIWTETKTYIDTADGTLQSNIDTVSGNLGTLSDTVTANKTDIEAKNTVVSNKVVALETKVASDKAELEGKITTAQTQADKGVADAAAAKTYASVASNNVMIAAKGFADAAEANAKSDAATNLANVKTELEGKIDLKDSITSVNSKINSVSNNVIAIAASTAQSKADTAESNAKTYTDTGVAGAKSYADAQDVKATNDVLRLAKEYTDSKDPGSKSYVQEQIAAVSNNVVAIASADATFKANDAKVYAIDKDGAVMRYADANDTVVSNAAIAAVNKAKSDLSTSISAVDTRVTEVKTFAESASNNVLTAANKYTSDTKVDLTNKISVAKSEAITEAKSYSDETILPAAKSYADAQDTVVSNAAIAAVNQAKSDLTTSINAVDTRVTEVKTFAEAASNNVLTAAKKFTTDTKSDIEGDIQTAKTEAISTAASDASTKTNAVLAEANAYSYNQLTNKIGVLNESTVMAEITAQANAAMSYSDNRLSNAKTDLLANDTVVSNAAIAAVNTAKSELSGSISTVDGKVGTLRTDMNTMSNNVLTAANTEAAKKVKALEDGAVAAAASAASVADGKAIEAKSAADVAKAAADAAQSTADDAVSAAAVADGKAVDAQGTADTAAAKLTDITGTVGNAITTAKESAISVAAADASAKTNALNKALIGVSSDATSAKTYYGLKNYSDSTFRKISDSYTKSEVYTKTEVNQSLTESLVTASNTTESVVASKVNAQAVEPTESEEEVYELKIKSNTVNTLLPKTNMSEGTELYVECDGDRNFKMFLPYEPELLCGLPITVMTEFPTGVQAAYATKKVVYKLPAKVVCEQPYEKLAVITVTELDTGTVWTPVITNMCIVCTNIDTTGVNPSPKFVTVGSHALEGTCLHAGTEFKVVYPTDLTAGITATNDLETVDSDGIISGTFYYYTGTTSLVPSGMAFDSDLKSWFKIIYKTVNGSAEVKQYDVQL